MKICRKETKLSLWLGVFALIVGMSLGSDELGAVVCNSQKPKNQIENCGAQSDPLCEGEHDGGFNCINNTKWYYEDLGVVNCVAGTVNDNCYDSSTIQITCACNYRCAYPNPATGFCEKGDPIEVLNEETEEMEPQCSYKWKKIANPSCTIPG